MDDVKGMDLSHMFLMPEWAIGLSLDSKYLESTGDHFLQLSDTSTVLEELKTFYDKEEGRVPEIDLNKEKDVQDFVLKAIKEGIVKSAHDCSEGGLAVSLAESCINGNIGAEIKLENSFLTDIAQLFAESQSRIVISVAKEDLGNLDELKKNSNLNIEKLGEVKGENLKINNLIDLPLKELKVRWKESIASKMEA